jgi:TolB-like protein
MKKHVLGALLLCGLAVTGCDNNFAVSHLNTSSLYLANNDYTDNRMAWEVYRATDRMMNQQWQVGKGTPVLVGTINDVDYLETSTTFGRVIQEQVMTRLTQRGFNVSELKLRNSLNIKQGLLDSMEGGEFMLSRDVEALRTEHRAGAVITGTYAVAGEEVMVNMKLIDVSTGKVMGATDFSVTLDRNTRRLVQTTGNKGFTFFGDSMAYNN